MLSSMCINIDRLIMSLICFIHYDEFTTSEAQKLFPGKNRIYESHGYIGSGS